MARLVEIGFNRGSNAAINLSDGFMIGRSLDCSHVIEEISISRKHCVFSNRAGHWFITDVSSNGIFINSLKIAAKKPIALKESDSIQLGEYIFEFRENSDPPVLNFDNVEVINIDDDSLIELAAVPKALEIAASTEQEPPEEIPNTNDFEEELTCSICTELFINAVTLNCQHSFCSLCIYKWRKNNKNCPICRKMISSEVPCIAVNNMVLLVTSRKSEEEQKNRAAVVAANEEEFKKVKESEKLTTNRVRGRGRGRGRQTRGRASRRGSHVGVPLRILDDVMEISDFSDSFSDSDIDDFLEVLRGVRSRMIP